MNCQPQKTSRFNLIWLISYMSIASVSAVEHGYWNSVNIIRMLVVGLLLTNTRTSSSCSLLRRESQSTWPCILFHPASNATWQVCSYQFNIRSRYYIYILGEAWVLNIIFWGMVLVVISRRLGRKKNTPIETH